MPLLRVAVVLAVLGLLVAYVWRRLVHDTRLRGRARIAATIGLGALVAPMMVVLVFVGGAGPPMVQGAIAWPTFLGWAFFLLTVVALWIVDLGRVVVWLGRAIARRPAPVDPGRRQAIARITGGVVTAAVATQVGVGMRSVLAGPGIVEQSFTLARLPRALDGFAIAQITDIHLGATVGRDFLEDIVERTNALGADAIAITGDLVDGSVDELGELAAPLGKLAARHGVYFVTGNHEYYSGADAWIAYLRGLGIRVLRNERVAIERDGAGFDLAGIDDYNAYGPGHRPDIAAAVRGRDPSCALVLLAHQPRQVHAAARHGVDLQISGHTHGGQVWPWHYLVAAQQGGLVAGRYQIGDTQLYVSRGTGYWGPPMRMLAPAEITRIVLRAPAA